MSVYSIVFDMTESVDFCSFSGTRKPKEDIIQYLKEISSDQVTEYARTVYCNGKCEPLEFTNAKHEKNVKSFLRNYQQTIIIDATKQKKCFARDSIHSDKINAYLLKEIFCKISEFIKNTGAEIILYGSSVCYFFSDAPYQLENCQLSDIDVATCDSDTVVKLSRFIYDWFVKFGSGHVFEFDESKIRIKNIQLRKNDHKYTIRASLMDDCEEKHFVGRLNLIDICPKTPFLDRTLKKDNFQIQNPVSFWLGMYDKYASCILNVNKLDAKQKKLTMEKMERRFEEIKIGKLDLNDLKYFMDKFNHFPQCEVVKKMIKTRLELLQNN